MRAAIADADLMDEALVEHAGAKDLIAQLQGMDVNDDLFDAKVTVLGELIDHHVEEEEGDMFPKAKKAQVDLEQLGASMATRRHEVLADLEPDTPDDSGRRVAVTRKRPGVTAVIGLTAVTRVVCSTHVRSFPTPLRQGREPTGSLSLGASAMRVSGASTWLTK